jgi:ketosteroid isomerase-like protein
MKKSLFLFTCFYCFVCCTSVQNNSNAVPSQVLVNLMHQSAEDWNNANLDAFMAIYDTASTFMFPTGPVGLARMRDNYERAFFKNGKPIQNLRFEDMVVRPLGNDHALLTGKFVLHGNNLPDKTGVYTLVFINRSTGWKLLHDHSS